MKRKAWYVPLQKTDHGYVVPENFYNLKPAFCDIIKGEFGDIQEEDLTLKEGQPFKVELVSFYVDHNYDQEHSKNDLLIQARTKYGAKLRTNTVNFFQKNIPLKHIKLSQIETDHDDILTAPYIYGVNLHNPLNRLHIELEIQEIDRNIVNDNNFIRSCKKLVSEVGAFFPSSLKYTKNINSSIGISEKINQIFKLIDRDPNITVFRESLDLYRLGLGETPLRQGIYILFSGTRDASDVLLHDNDGAHGAMYTWKDDGLSCIEDNGTIWDHIAIRIVPCSINELMSNELLINQDASTLIAPLWSHEYQDIDQIRGKIQELKQIIDDASKIELLKDLRKLYDQLVNEKPINMVSLIDPFAENLIEKARSDIASYIPEEWSLLLEQLLQVKRLKYMYRMLVETPEEEKPEAMKNFPSEIQKDFIRESIGILSDYIPDEEIEFLKRTVGISQVHKTIESKLS